MLNSERQLMPLALLGQTPSKALALPDRSNGNLCGFAPEFFFVKT
ncbi:hypothetical protein [Nostoc sp.]